VWTPASDRWYQSIGEVQQDFSKYDFGSHLVLRDMDGELPVSDCLEEIILDIPDRLLEEDPDVRAYDAALGALSVSKAASDLEAPIEAGSCDKSCECMTEYSQMRLSEIRNRFGMWHSLSMFVD
jgi:hypothetical protein